MEGVAYVRYVGVMVQGVLGLKMYGLGFRCSKATQGSVEVGKGVSSPYDPHSMSIMYP